MADSSLYTELKIALSSVSGKALNYSSRLILSNNMNIKHALLSKSGLARDYRGLAELMGFQYCNIKVFERSEDPTLRILEAWETQPSATLDKLVSFLEELDRYDVIKELAPSLERNAKAYLESQKLLEILIQDSEMTTSTIGTQLVKDVHICTEEDLKASASLPTMSTHFEKDLPIPAKKDMMTCEEFLKSNLVQDYCITKFVTLEEILPWSKFSRKVKSAQSSTDLLILERIFSSHPYMTKDMRQKYPKRVDLNEKVSLYYGSITDLKIDAIVNGANPESDGLNGAIHRAAGPELLIECSTLGGCRIGEAKITKGYNLPAKYVIHTVGPFGEDSNLLYNCYYNSLAIAKKGGLRTVAFPCISTGLNSYPREKAAQVALKTVRSFLVENESSFDRIIFSVIVSADIWIYEALMQHYFPV